MSSPAASRVALALLAVLVASCAPVAATTAPTASSSSPDASASAMAPPSSSVPATTATRSPAAGSARPTGSLPAASIPGFEGWTIFNPASVAASADDGTLVLTLTRRALWFQAQRGALVWKPVDGDFRIAATVEVARTIDAAAPLDEGGTVRLGGLMARADGVRENYVFVVVGADANGLSVETKSTHDNDSRFEGPDWPATAADLRLCRSGSTFTMLKRPAGSGDPWAIAATIDRPDLPPTLQVGPNLYSDGPPDLTARYENLVLEGLPAGARCDA